MENDFSKGSIINNILSLAIPMTLAQLINVLYNIVDRIYIGRIPNEATLAMTGLGICLPVISVVIAFANLFGTGGAPLCSIERGRGNVKEAEAIMGNSFVLMIVFGVLLTVIGLIFKYPLLRVFGASDLTMVHANRYLSIYLLGSVFVMTGLGMNNFINAQGFGKIGMMTVLLGAVVNLILDPIFIFAFQMGVQGAALATVISQAVSAIWIISFLTGKRAILKLRLSSMRISAVRSGQIFALGLSGFTMSITNSIVQALCNITLQSWGGDLYVGVMTVINSIREIVTMPVLGLTHSAQPVIGYNYGAEEYGRVRKCIWFVSASSMIYTALVWLFLHAYPETFIRIFNQDEQLIRAAVPSMQIYYFGFFMMSLQFAGQAVFVAMGKAKQAIFFSVFRKVIIVAPLTVLLPHLFSLSTRGVFAAEPISNCIGGMACYGTMLYVVFKEFKQKEKGMIQGKV